MLYRFNPSTIEPPFQPAPKPSQRTIKFLHHPFFQRNDSVVGDLNAFRANLGAAFRAVAVAESVSVSQFLQSLPGVARIHPQPSPVNRKRRADDIAGPLTM